MKMLYQDQTYISEALKHNLISSEEEVQSFSYGHLTGLEAIKGYFEALDSQCIPTINRFPKKLCLNTVEKLKSFFYNGMSVDEIIKEATTNLGERMLLYKHIIESDSSKRFLSFDRTHSQPRHNPLDGISESELGGCDELFEQMDPAKRPRSREAILRFLEENHIRISNLDMVISYLVARELI